MDPTHYQHLKYFLQTDILPTDIPAKQAKTIFKQSKFFIVKNNIIYKKDRRNQNNLLKVLQTFEIEPILFLTHNHPLGGHFGTDIMFNKIRNLYYWPQMYVNIRDYVKSCDSCQRRGKKRLEGPLNPIEVKEPFQQIGIDIVGPLPITPRNNRYIVVATDYMTRWPEACPIQKANAAEVVDFIYDEIICRHGCPKIILSDRGTHFRNQLVDTLLEKLQVKHYLSTPYHPQTNGLVERFNKTLCESLAKLCNEVTEWDLLIPSVLFAYRTAKQSTTKIEPFYLVYGRQAKLPISIEQPEEMENNDIFDRIQDLIDVLPQTRENAKVQIKKVQQKQKNYHDQQPIRKEQFQIGDKVLMYNAAKDKQWSGKLEPKWKGPFYVHEVLQKGAYKLRTLNGKVLAAPINVSLLKEYHDRQNWQPTIYIDA